MHAATPNITEERMTSTSNISVTYVHHPGVDRQQHLLDMIPDGFWCQVTAKGESVLSIVYVKVFNQPKLLQILSFLLPYWDSSMDDADCAKWGELLATPELAVTVGAWDVFYNGKIASKDTQFCTSGTSIYDQRLLWIKLVPKKGKTMNVSIDDLLTIGLQLNCMDVDILRQIENECVFGCWQQKVFSRLLRHDLSQRSVTVKGFLLCFLTGKVSQSDMQAMWQKELGRLFSMMEQANCKDIALDALEAMAKRCTTKRPQVDAQLPPAKRIK